MNIYLIERSEYDYDEYDAFVVASDTPENALHYLEERYNPDKKYGYSSWPNNGEKTATLIGTTDKYNETTIILDSFEAG